MLLTEEEKAALSRYNKEKGNTPTEDLLVGRAGLERELKKLEELDGAESTLPLVLTIAAIDRRLNQRDGLSG